MTTDELERFASSHFDQIEYDLGKSLSDLQKSNLLNGDKLAIENLINRKLSKKETGKLHFFNLIFNRKNYFSRTLSC